MREYIDERAAVADYMRRLYERGLTTCLAGNISLRIGDIVLITPAKVDKGRINPKQVGIMTMEGEKLTPVVELSIETEMHLSVLQNRADISAVIHAHPTIATFFSATDVDINTTLTAEAYAALGVPLKVPYVLMGTKQLASSVSQAAMKSNVVIMENHGILTVGENLLEAFNRVEILESVAKMNWIMKSGSYSIKTMAPQALEEIVKKVGKI